MPRERRRLDPAAPARQEQDIHLDQDRSRQQVADIQNEAAYYAAVVLGMDVGEPVVAYFEG